MRVMSQVGGVVVEAVALSIKGNEDESWEVIAHAPMVLTLFEGKHGLRFHESEDVHMAYYSKIQQAYAEIASAAESTTYYRFARDYVEDE